MKRILQVLGWAAYLTISFRICLRTPLNQLFFNIEAVLVVLLFLFFMSRMILAASGRIKLQRIDLFYIFLMIFPVWSAFASFSEWNQPWYYGIGTQRSFYLYLSGYYILHCLRKGSLNPDVLRDAFLVSAWGSLIGFLITSSVLNPARYAEYDFVGYNEVKGGFIFKFIVTFITFAVLYYSIRFFKTGKLIWLIAAAALFYYVAFVRQDRSIVLTTIITVGIYYVQNELLRKPVQTFFTILTAGVAVLVIALSVGITALLPISKQYENVFATIQGNATQESSTNVRRLETVKVIPYIQKNFFFGNGELSLKYRNGFARIFGYFYPADIGLIGELFTFGLIGVVLLNSQFLLGFYYAQKVKTHRNDILFLTCKYSLFTFLMDSFTAGQTIYYSANSIVVISVIYYYSTLNEKEEQLTVIPNRQLQQA